MAKILSFSRKRKQGLREKKQQKADRNAILFGRTRLQKHQEDTEKQRSARFLDGHRRNCE